MSKINEIKKILGMKNNEDLKIVTITPEIACELLVTAVTEMKRK